MDSEDFKRVSQRAPSPSFIVELDRLRHNLALLDQVQIRTGAKVLLALKGFAMHSVFPLLRKTLHGTCASGSWEAQLGHHEFGGEVHCFAPAFTQEDINELLPIAHHLVFNSFNQWHQWRDQVESAPRSIECGLRINPEHSEGTTAIYDPCASGSRLGIRRQDFEGHDLSGISGIHWHTLCEQNSDALERTLDVVIEKFDPILKLMKWINLGGGHHITRDDYDIDRLCRCINRIKERYNVQVYLEPGEAVALNAGILLTTVLDVIENDGRILILDTSAQAHMPDVIEMPYRPEIMGAGAPGEKAFTYQLAGMTCLAGDRIGSYSFDHELKPGDQLAFLDMAHYSMVKTTTFNGVKHPALTTWDSDTQELKVVRKFDYTDYRNRLS